MEIAPAGSNSEMKLTSLSNCSERKKPFRIQSRGITLGDPAHRQHTHTHLAYVGRSTWTLEARLSGYPLPPPPRRSSVTLHHALGGLDS